MHTLPYSVFSRVYDKTMKEIPYHHWAYYIYQIFEDFKLSSDDWVVDIGAGTGVLSRKLAPYYNLAALDISAGMLVFARQNTDLKCIQADMVNIPFASQSFSAAYSTHDCLNYLTEEASLIKHFSEIYRILRPGGLYIFDYSTEYNVIRNFNHRTFNERHGNYQMRWENEYDRSNRMVRSTIDVTEYLPYWFGFLIFWKKKKLREVHLQKIFSEENLEKFFKKAGFEVINKDYDYNENVSEDHAHIVVYTIRKSDDLNTL